MWISTIKAEILYRGRGRGHGRGRGRSRPVKNRNKYEISLVEQSNIQDIKKSRSQESSLMNVLHSANKLLFYADFPSSNWYIWGVSQSQSQPGTYVIRPGTMTNDTSTLKLNLKFSDIDTMKLTFKATKFENRITYSIYAQIDSVFGGSYRPGRFVDGSNEVRIEVEGPENSALQIYQTISRE